MLKRREFITGLGASTAVWPRVAHAQQPLKRIGVLMPRAADDAEVQERLGAMRRGLQELGWIDGKSIRIEYRWPGNDAGRIRVQAKELVSLAPDLIVAGSLLTAMELKQLTRSIPILFANVADPVGNGLVSGLARPGANVTGFAAYEGSIVGKWLELLKEIAPRTTRVALIFGAQEAFGANGEMFHRVAREIAPAFSLGLAATRFASVDEIEPAIGRFAALPNGGLVAAAEAGAMGSRALIIAAAARYRVPAVYPFRFCAEEGGLAAYGVDLNDQYRRLASYIDRVLKGTNPADLPVQAPDKFELIINLKTAKAAGIDIAPVLLGRADEVIE